MYDLGDRPWFQWLQRLPRPLQSWGFGVAAVSYAFRPHLGLSFNLEVFAALAAAAGVAFITRGVEKHSTAKVAANAAVQVEQARSLLIDPDSGATRPDIPEGGA